jgi:circadian clock protein KaiC
VGPPGAGKTVLAEQIACHIAHDTQSTLYLTGYSETHDKLITHGSAFRFFNPAVVGRQLQFVSIPDLLREGVGETLTAILGAARSQRPSFVVLDGFGGLRRLLADDSAVAEFLYSIGAQLALLGATTMVCLEGDADAISQYPETAAADVILALRMSADGQRRSLQVVKSRGTAPLLGRHPFAITSDGITVYPRFESTVPVVDASAVGERAAFGIARLDEMLHGGLNAGTIALVAGNPGMGKTLLSLHFLAEGARLGEPSLFIGMNESESQLREQARTFGLAMGDTRFVILPGYELEADYMATIIRDDVEQRGVRRLVIDSASEVERSMADPSRTEGFLAALVSFVRSHRTTAYMTLEMDTIAGSELSFDRTPLSIVAESLLLLRNVEYRGQLHRVCSVLKMRFSDHDRAIYEYSVREGRGIEIDGPAPLGAGLLTGLARPYNVAPGEATGVRGGEQ